jgi:hypothetical protein
LAGGGRHRDLDENFVIRYSRKLLDKRITFGRKRQPPSHSRLRACGKTFEIRLAGGDVHRGARVWRTTLEVWLCRR